MARNGKDDNTWAVPQSGEDAQETEKDECFFVALPERKNPFFYIYNMLRDGILAQTYASDDVRAMMNNTITWQERLAMFLMQTLRYLSSPLAKVGQVVELTGNIINANGGLIRTLLKLLYSGLFFFKKGALVVPAQKSADYLTAIGLIDPRKDLLVIETSSTASDLTESNDHGGTKTSKNIFPGPGNGDRRIADLMQMAAKFSYENEALVKEVVTNSWQMNFVGFYNCWNDYQQRFNQEVYIFTDKAQDANAIVVAWRGTEPFNAQDWSTDVDFSWYDLQGDAGKVHVGFLEALGLGDRHDMTTFSKLRKNAHEKKEKKSNRDREFLQDSAHNTSSAASGLPQDIIDAPEKILAYDDVTKVVKGLLAKNPNAKVFITGHSLGGALAMLYSGMLYYFGEDFVTDRIASVYTFGQPRVGDEKFCQFMLENLTIERYFRVVYSNDIVPRLPFDDPLFRFKHWGLCYYFSSMYKEQTMKEAPNPNYFNISDFLYLHINALYELINSLFIGYEHGPTYKESTASFLFRVLALFLPGIGSHSLVNYCNALRLGKPMPLVAKLN